MTAVETSAEHGQRRFRDAMALLATGVTVITTESEEGPVGMTASAVCSLSAQPPQLLTCISTTLLSHQAIEGSGHFAVNILSDDQEGLARRFAAPIPDRFAGVRLREGCRLPVLDRAIAYFVCDVAERFPGGDHSIFVGRVRECDHDPGRRPLLYFSRSFEGLRSPEAALLEDWADGRAFP